MFLSEWREFLSASCLAEKKKLEIARIPDMLPSLFPSWLGYGLISTPVKWRGREVEHSPNLVPTLSLGSIVWTNLPL